MVRKNPEPALGTVCTFTPSRAQLCLKLSFNHQKSASFLVCAFISPRNAIKTQSCTNPAEQNRVAPSPTKNQSGYHLDRCREIVAVWEISSLEWNSTIRRNTNLRYAAVQVGQAGSHLRQA